MATMSYLEIKEKLNSGDDNITDEDWLKMYHDAQLLPEDLRKELFSTRQGDVLAQMGTILMGDWK